MSAGISFVMIFVFLVVACFAMPLEYLPNRAVISARLLVVSFSLIGAGISMCHAVQGWLL